MRKIVGTLLLAAGLRAGTSFEAVILDPMGGLVTGALVTIRPVGKPALFSAQSGANGRVALDLEPGRYSMRVAATGFERQDRAVEWKPGNAPLEIVLALAENREVVTVTEASDYRVPVSGSTKAPTALIDVPQAISVVTRELMRDQLMQSMAEVVRYVPGITMAQGEGHRDAPVIRGNATTADFYVNGVRDDVQYFRDTYNVERVEAVKGANALTFGRGGGGGVINRVTKQAEFAPVREISLQGGTFGNKRVTTDLGRAFGEKLALRFSGLYENSGSFRHDVDVERYGLAPTLTAKVSERTQIKAGYEYFNDGRTVDRGVPSWAGRPAPAHRATFFGDPAASYSTAGVHLGSGSVEHQWGGWFLRNTTLVGNYDKFYQNVFPGAVNATQTLVSISGYNNLTDRRNLFNQTDASATFATGRIRHTVLIGSEFGRQSTANFRNTAYFNGAATATNVPFWSPNGRLAAAFRQSSTDADNGAVNRINALFAQDQMELTRHIQLVAGVRYDHFAIRFQDRRTPLALQRTDQLVSPRLGLVLKPVASVSLYGSYGVSYLPSAGDQFSSLTATTQTLRPEKFHNYEMGAKLDIRRGLSLTTALYRLDRENTTARDPNNPAVIVQTGSQRTNGFELGANGSLTSRWQVAGGYAAQDAFISSATTAAALGAKVALVPQQTFSLWNNYRILSRWSMGLGAVHQARMFAGIDNQVALPRFTRFDAAVFVPLTETIRLQANLENVFNTSYYPTAHSNNNILPGSPRVLRIGLTARF